MAKNSTIHEILAHSYLVNLVFSILGLVADTFLDYSYNIVGGKYIAISFFALGTILIYWAQYTSGYKNIKNNELKVDYFFEGPYRYIRNPTHIGILLLVTGYTIVSGSVFFCLSTIVGYFISNIFYKKYEAVLNKTLDGRYKDYQNKVTKIL